MVKKKGGKGKKKPKTQEVDETTEKFFRMYFRKLKEVGLTMPFKMKQNYEEMKEEKVPTPLKEAIVWDKTGPEGTKALADALREINYQHCKSLRFWKAYCQDEGVRSVCQFIQVNNNIKVLEFMDCDLTALACEHLGKLLSPQTTMCNILVLRLDHNNFGNQGIANLSTGLRMNHLVQVLSLSYCNLGFESARYLMEIVIFHKCAIKLLDLQGNYLMNDGVVVLFEALTINKSLENIQLSDNQFGEHEEVMKKLCTLIETRPNLQKYDMRFNGFYDMGANLLKNSLTNAKHITYFRISEKGIQKQLFKEIIDIVKSNKPKKKKKGKGMMGKKKKK